MSELVGIAWPIATVSCFALGTWRIGLWLRLRAEAERRAEERLELAKGIAPTVEAIRAETVAARTEMRTFIANNRGRNG